MNTAAGPYDYMLGVTLVFLAVQVLRARDLLTGIILFIIFGILVSMAWVQLNAPDIALVEAVIGSALTGALFLASLGQIESREAPAERRLPRRHNLALTAAALAVAGVLLAAVAALPRIADGLSPEVYGALMDSGVKNPVTAVILNFRGYDTLLEIGVLYLAALAVFTLSGLRPVGCHLRDRPASRVLVTFLHILNPLMIVTAFYLLWAGADAPGGAFQAGAMLAGVGILMLLGGVRLPVHAGHILPRTGYVLGFAGFLVAGLSMLGSGNNFLEYPRAHAKAIIFVIELLATASIALILLVLFAACAGFFSAALAGAPNREEGA
ncbi:MAG: DUF4040 domain-containing protein [Candidatus Omnitrophica bacterium]|nr:DUF4040 domain-containing protein [Candidatus Omnitrophota bacterium]MCB9720160.1 DUF4040 domain-containing protein [Candidatus Omnitrophota bacterium]